MRTLEVGTAVERGLSACTGSRGSRRTFPETREPGLLFRCLVPIERCLLHNHRLIVELWPENILAKMINQV